MPKQQFNLLLSAYRKSDLGKYMSFKRVLIIFKHLKGYEQIAENDLQNFKDNIKDYGAIVVSLA